jgi:hypothetical protein
MKRRNITVFSLSFLDCICCGLGAVILLFVIVNAKSSLHRDEVTSDLRGEVNRLENEVLEGQKDLIEARNTLQKTQENLAITEGLAPELIKTIEEKKIETAQYENDTLATKAHIHKLKTDLQSREEDVKRLEAGSKAREGYGEKLRSFPGEGDRQYLTDLKAGGKRIFILVDASASMLDDSIVGIILRRNLNDTEKLKSEKWRQTVATIDWLTTQFPQTSKFQVYTFNETAWPVVGGTDGTWMDAGDVGKLNEAVDGLRKVVPQKGTSLLNAFNAMREITPKPDNIFLLTDGLPTMGARKPWGKTVSGNKRLKLFQEAASKLPKGVPVNIILYPMEGDPLASSFFWRLAVFTDGSFFCPSRDWP